MLEAGAVSTYILYYLSIGLRLLKPVLGIRSSNHDGSNASILTPDLSHWKLDSIRSMVVAVCVELREANIMLEV